MVLYLPRCSSQRQIPLRYPLHFQELFQAHAGSCSTRLWLGISPCRTALAPFALIPGLWRNHRDPRLWDTNIHKRDNRNRKRNRGHSKNAGRGNHKSAQEGPVIVEQFLSKDVGHGFSMVIPIGLVPLISKAMVQLVGLQSSGPSTKKATER